MTGDIQSYLSDMASAARSKSGDALLVFNIDQVLKTAGPRKAEVLRRCAIPRWFDLSILRVLRENDEGNERILDQMRELSFVRDMGDGRLAYHDEVRQILLAEWARERPDELAQIHRRLYSYFSNRTTPPGSNRKAMPLVPDSTMLSVVPLSIQSDMFRREALYHLLNADSLRGMDELRAAFGELQAAHRLADAELLLQVAAEAPLSPLQQRWLQYLRARTQQGSLNLVAAARQLEALRAMPDLDPELGAETNRALAEVYSETGQWSQATRLFRQSLDYFARTGNQRAVADTMLLLGEAYQGLGMSTGSWHVPYVPENRLLRYAQIVWIWLLGLPFQLAIAGLGPQSRMLPLPEYCAHYQNWLLIRLYNTSRNWYAQAREAFRRLGDEGGMLRAEQRLIDILRLYGYHEEARAQVEALMKRQPARDIYWRAWLDRTLAECHLAAGNLGSAQVLLASALIVFRDLGDVRREATILMLQGQAAMQAGDSETALSGFAVSLERYRRLGYAAARERILHELRAWKHQPNMGAGLRQRIGDLIAAEPEKRYVGRFIRSYLPLLQIASLLALPMALLITAVVAPTTNIIVLTGNVLSQSTFYDPLRILVVLLSLTGCYLLAYGLLASAVIYWLPINRIEREQPDVIVTRPESIARYNRMGDLELEQPWPTVRRWLALDRCIWARPLPLYSRSFLEDAAGRDLAIDGITGWYGDLQSDIALRLRAAGSPLERENLGYRLLKSKSGAAAVSGMALLLLVTLVENQALQLPIWFPAQLYALLSSLAFSGALLLAPLAYWMANRPLKLQRALLLNDNWPNVLLVLGGLPVLLYLISGGHALSIDELNYSTFVWGVYVVCEAALARFLPGRRDVRLAVVIVMPLLAVLLVAQPAYASYRWRVGYTAKGQVADAAAVGAAPTGVSEVNCAAAGDARNLGNDPYSTYMIQGDCAAVMGDWQEAVGYYRAAVDLTPADSSERALALYNLWNVARRTGDKALTTAALDQTIQLCRTSRRAQQACLLIWPKLPPSPQP
jgi:tetratricopeptide (TPR) repeat protein